MSSLSSNHGSPKNTGRQENNNSTGLQGSKPTVNELSGSHIQDPFSEPTSDSSARKLPIQDPFSDPLAQPVLHAGDVEDKSQATVSENDNSTELFDIDVEKPVTSLSGGETEGFSEETHDSELSVEADTFLKSDGDIVNSDAAPTTTVSVQQPPISKTSPNPLDIPWEMMLPVMLFPVVAFAAWRVVRGRKQQQSPSQQPIDLAQSCPTPPNDEPKSDATEFDSRKTIPNISETIEDAVRHEDAEESTEREGLPDGELSEPGGIDTAPEKLSADDMFDAMLFGEHKEAMVDEAIEAESAQVCRENFSESISQLQAANQELNRTLDLLQEQNDDLVRALETSQSELKTTVVRLESRNAELGCSLNELQESILAAGEAMNRNESLEEATQKVEELIAKNSIVEAELSVQVAKKDKWKKRLVNLHARASSMKTKWRTSLAEAETKLVESQKSEMALEEINRELSRRIDLALSDGKQIVSQSNNSSKHSDSSEDSKSRKT